MSTMKIFHFSSFLLVLNLCSGFNECFARPIHSEASTMKGDVFKKMNGTAASTFCIGRFLIDLPAGSKLSGGNYKYDFTRIEPVETATFTEFERVTNKLESDLKAKNNERTKQSMLLGSVHAEKSTRILAAWKAEFSTALISIDGYKWINGNQFRFQDDVGGDRQELGLNSMRDALARLRPRDDGEIPAEPGYCFAGGFIANSSWVNEQAGVDIDIAGHPDAFVSIEIYPLASYKHDKPLLERMGGIAQALANLVTSMRVLRKGNRQIGLYKGQEHLASAPTDNGTRGHAFVWETQGDGTLDTPSIKIELTTGHRDNNGNPQATSLTDRQAIKLWDEILASFRLRPSVESIK